MNDGEARLRRWQRATLAALVVGYAGYYLCRSNFSVTLPLIEDELVATGFARDAARVRLGELATFGTLAYAFGKFVSGAATERLGGRRAFLGGMGLSVVSTLAFAASGTLPLFTLAWIANRLVQSMGWVGMVKIASRWFPATAYGSAFGVISLSFLFGDAVARAAMGALIARGVGWHAIFVIAAATLAALAALCAWIVRESPGERGVPEPAAPDDDLFAHVDAGAHRTGELRAREILRTLFASRAFRIACFLSLGMTLLRETFNTWTPTYLGEAVGFSRGDAASASALFPLLGGVSVLVAGSLSDRLGARGRAWILAIGVALVSAALLLLAWIDPATSGRSALALISLVGFLLIGPYSYLAGAVSLDFGGKRGSATASGILDGVGYLGGALAGGGVARLTLVAGWSGAFLVLAAVAGVTAAAGAAFVRERSALR